MDNGFSSPRIEAFPAGLRVLVVDDDLPWLRILEKMLKKCSYEVTTCSLAREALDLLRERKDGFDIVISDVNMPDMDGFKLLEHVGLEMDLPVIMMSVDGETSRVMRGVQHGACDYLLKPIRMKELRNIWQHVFRKRIHEVRDIESHEGFDEFHRRRLDHFEDGLFLGAGELFSGKKRKDIDSNEFSDSSSVRKARVIWTIDLHQKFVTAVNQIGLDKVGPKKILDLMNVPWLTRENVASHLQKYRLYLSRLQKENETKPTCGAAKETDLTSKDSLSSVIPHNLTNLHQNNSGIETCAISSNNALVQNVDPKFRDTDLEKIILLPIQEPKKARIQDLCPVRPLEPHVKYAPSDSLIRETYFWNQVPETPFKKEESFSQLSQNTPPRHIEVACEVLENKRKEPKEMKRSHTNNERQQVRETGSFQGETDLFQIPVSLKKQLFLNDPKTSYAPSSGDLFSCLFQGDNNYETNIDIQTKESFNHSFPELLSESTMYMYDPQRLGNEYQWESPEYPVIDQGLFII